MNQDREYHRRRLLKGYRKALRDTEDLVASIESWNANRIDAEPFDVGGDKVFISLLKQIIAKLEANENIPEDLRERLLEQGEANART